MAGDGPTGSPRLQSELRFIEEHGGRRWMRRYIDPYYLHWMGSAAAFDVKARRSIPAVRRRAHRLSVDDISTMVGMQWRIQVMGAWYAIARGDDHVAVPLHEAFKVCYGSLTAPALVVAALTYPTDRSTEVLLAYRERDVANQYGTAGLVDAALRHLGHHSVAEDGNLDDENLAALMGVAASLQSHA